MTLMLATCRTATLSLTARVDLDIAASQEGSYIGVDPMGLVLCMKSLLDDPDYEKCAFHQRRYENPLKSIKIQFALYSDHIDSLKVSCEPLATESVKRVLKSKDVNRFEVRQGRIRGVLFVPKRDTVLPGVVDIGGVPYPGEVYDIPASLIASHGYVTLALAYCDFDNLPSRSDTDFEYFLEALEWFHSLPQVKKYGLVIARVREVPLRSNPLCAVSS